MSRKPKSPTPAPPEPDYSALIRVILANRRDDEWNAAWDRLLTALEPFIRGILFKQFPSRPSSDFDPFWSDFQNALWMDKLAKWDPSRGTSFKTWVAEVAINFFMDTVIRPEKTERRRPPRRIDGKPPRLFEPASPQRPPFDVLIDREEAAEPDLGVVVQEILMKVPLERRVIYKARYVLPPFEGEEQAAFERLFRRRHKDVLNDPKWNPPSLKFLASIIAIRASRQLLAQWICRTNLFIRDELIRLGYGPDGRKVASSPPPDPVQ